MRGFLTLVRRVSVRHFAGRKLRTLLTVAGIAAGVALVFSISVINATLLSSFRSSLRDLAGTAELEVAAPDPSGLPQRVLEQVATVPGVERAVPLVRATTQLHGPAREQRALVLGITPEFGSLFPRDLGPLARLELSGGFGASGRGLVLSRTLAHALAVRPGRSVGVESPTGRRQVEVSGVLKGGAVAAINGGQAGIMLLPAAQEVFGKSGRVDSVYVTGDEDVSLASIERGIEERLSGSAVVGAPGERGRGLERVFAGLGTLTSLAGTTALFVAMFVVYNTMSMSLAERRREISMALAIGASRRQLFGAFLGEAALLGALASAAGIGGGILLARVLVERAIDAYRVLSIGGAGPIVVQPLHLLLGAASGVAVAVIGAFVPARRILGVAPVEALRPEASYEWARSRGGTSRRAWGVFAGLAAVVAALGVGAIYVVLYPDDKWLVTLSMVLGLAGVTLLLPRIVPFAVGIVRPLFSGAFGTVGRLSGDALAKNPGRTTFTVAALVLTLGLVIGVGAAVGSYQTQVESMATAVIGAPIYVTAESFTGLSSDQPLPGALQKDLEGVEGVDYVYPIRSALLSLGERQATLFAVPVDEALEHDITTELDAMTDDPEAFRTGLARGDIAISRLTSEQRGLQPGDDISIPTPSGRRTFRISATFDDLVSFESFYLDYATYVRLWKDDKVDQFGIVVDPDRSVATVQRDLTQTVRREGVPARVYTKEQLVGRILRVVAGTFSLGRGIQLAALIVAILTIANTMFTAVLERRWELGLQRAIGMGGGQISRSILLEAIGIGAIGAIGGTVLGLASGWLMTRAMEVQFAWQIPFRPPLGLLALALGAGVAMAAGAGLVPSRLATRTPIIEALRYE